MENKIELGDKVRCIYTGFTGIAVARTEFINGCIQYSVIPKWDKKSPIIEETGVDEGSLEVIKRKKKKKVKKEDDDGGAMRIGKKFRGY